MWLNDHASLTKKAAIWNSIQVKTQLCNILIAIYYDVSRFCSVESGIRYNCAAVHYDMHVGSLSLEFALVSSLLLPLLHLVVPVMFLLWHCRYSFILSRKCLAVLDSIPENSASI